MIEFILNSHTLFIINLIVIGIYMLIDISISSSITYKISLFIKALIFAIFAYLPSPVIQIITFYMLVLALIRRVIWKY